MADLEQFKLETARDYDASSDSREKQNEDMRFVSVDGGMWEGFLSNTHNDTTKRARLELDIISDFVMRFIGEWMGNRKNVTYTPDDKATTDDDAELMNGIYRADFKDNDGQISQDNAVLETAITGVGAFKFVTKFVDEDDPENEDQEICFVPINNAFNHVMWDENATRVDKADANRVTVLTAHSRDAFERAWPDAEPSSAYVPTNMSEFDWSTREVIYVAERYEVVKKKETIQVWQHVEGGQIKGFNEEQFELLGDELKALGWEFVRERKLTRRTIEKSIFTGNEFLEKPKRVAGKYLPIIPMYGIRAYVDNKEFARGLVRKLKDSNRIYNMGVSKWAEVSAASGEEQPIFTERQIDGKENLWASRHGKPYMVINDIEDAQGNPIAQGPVGIVGAPQVDPNTIAVVEAVSNYVQRQTGNAPQDTVDPDASGKAINALRARENLNTKVIRENIETAIVHSGRVYEAIAADIYTRAQMKKVLGSDGKTKMVQLNQSSLDPQTGNPINLNDLSRCRFSVDAEVGSQYESQKEATIETVKEALSIVDPTSPYFGPLMATLFENIEGTGLEKLKAFNRKLMLTQGLAEPESEEEAMMVQAIQQQPDPNQILIEATANQQNAEAENLRAATFEKAAKSQKTLAETEKTKAETAAIITDIGAKRAEMMLERFSRIPVGPADFARIPAS